MKSLRMIEPNMHHRIFSPGTQKCWRIGSNILAIDMLARQQCQATPKILLVRWVNSSNRSNIKIRN